jgi:hypothetical protein
MFWNASERNSSNLLRKEGTFRAWAFRNPGIQDVGWGTTEARQQNTGPSAFVWRQRRVQPGNRDKQLCSLQHYETAQRRSGLDNTCQESKLVYSVRSQLVYSVSSFSELLSNYFSLHGLSPRANYTDRATAACRRSDCQLLRIEGATWSAGQRDGSVRPFSRFSRQEPLLFYQVAPQLYSRGWVDHVPDPLLFFLVVPGIEPGPPDLQPRTLTTRSQRRSLYNYRFKFDLFVTGH